MTISSTANQGVGAKAADIDELERMLSRSPSTESVCLKLAKILHVRRGEVALLRLERNSLRFLFPVELRTAGILPLTGSAVAARTAVTRSPLLSNTFMRVRHVSLFEAIKLAGEEEEDKELEQMPIQKIMSVPVVDAQDKVLGVVQVSRKGADASLAGPDFTGEDLKRLRKAADILARMPFMQEGAEF